MSKEREMYIEAQKYLIGGGSAGGRFNAIYGQPLYLDHADGPRIYDVDGNSYVEYHSSAGPVMFGYNNPRLKKAANEGMDKGAFVFYDSQDMIDLARTWTEIFPCAELVRFVNSGTEATMGAIRLARSYTKKDIIIRMEGHFHGMHELLWYNHNKEGEMDEIGEIQPVPDGSGIPKSLYQDVKVVQFNDIDALENVCKRYRGKVAAIMLEPISFNCGCYMAKKEYLQQVRELCDREGIVLIFDEVICAFRMRPGCAQAMYGVTPDLTTVGKAVGGGYPIAGIVGKREVMSEGSPVGKAGISGTYVGSILVVKVAQECAKMIQEPGFYDKIEATADHLYNGMNDLFRKHGIKGHVRGVGARFGIYFGVEDPEDDFNWRTVKSKFDGAFNNRFIAELLKNGVYFHDYGTSPVPAHNGFGTTHTPEDIDFTLEQMDKVLKKIK